MNTENLLTVRQFADKCGVTFEAIRKKINKEIIPATKSTVTIDSDKYDFIIKYFQNKRNPPKHQS